MKKIILNPEHSLGSCEVLQKMWTGLVQPFLRLWIQTNKQTNKQTKKQTKRQKSVCIEKYKGIIFKPLPLEFMILSRQICKSLKDSIIQILQSSINSELYTLFL